VSVCLVVHPPWPPSVPSRPPPYADAKCEAAVRWGRTRALHWRLAMGTYARRKDTPAARANSSSIPIDCNAPMHDYHPLSVLVSTSTLQPTHTHAMRVILIHHVRRSPIPLISRRWCRQMETGSTPRRPHLTSHPNRAPPCPFRPGGWARSPRLAVPSVRVRPLRAQHSTLTWPPAHTYQSFFFLSRIINPALVWHCSS
jgi:hypothetical protein